jgi:hypothetical protein
VFRGTAFFVATPIGCGVNLLSLVTAKHVAEKLDKTGSFCIRVNTNDGTSKEFWVDSGIDVQWIYHSTDASVDAALLIWSPPDYVAYKAIPPNMFLTPDILQQKGIGIGDQTYVTGLFTYLHGSACNMPIVRSGHIAMMPSERIRVKWHNNGMEGYLIETRSIGGLSGSPVFVERSIKVQPAEHSGSEPLAAGAVFWLGLVHGHWDIPEDQIGIVTTGNKREDRINSGIASIVPSHKILEIINQKDVQCATEKAFDKIYLEQNTLFLRTSPDALHPEKVREAARLFTQAVIDASVDGTK